MHLSKHLSSLLLSVLLYRVVPVATMLKLTNVPAQVLHFSMSRPLVILHQLALQQFQRFRLLRQILCQEKAILGMQNHWRKPFSLLLNLCVLETHFHHQTSDNLVPHNHTNLFEQARFQTALTLVL